MQVHQTSARSLMFVPSPPGNIEEMRFLHEVMECLEPPATLPLVRVQEHQGQKLLTFHIAGNTLAVESTTPEERQLYDRLARAIREGGDIISARIWCDGGWMACFDVPGWSQVERVTEPTPH